MLAYRPSERLSLFTREHDVHPTVTFCFEGYSLQGKNNFIFMQREESRTRKLSHEPRMLCTYIPLHFCFQVEVSGPNAVLSALHAALGLSAKVRRRAGFPGGITAVSWSPSPSRMFYCFRGFSVGFPWVFQATSGPGVRTGTGLEEPGQRSGTMRRPGKSECRLIIEKVSYH